MANTRYAPLNPADLVTTDTTGVATINQGDTITKGVKNYRYAGDTVTYKNSAYSDPAGAPTGTPTPTPTPGVPTSDPVADYYNKLSDYNPATDEATIRQKAADQMQASLDAIDAKYVSIFANDATDATNRLGQDRSRQARGGIAGSDFGGAQTETVVKTNKQIADADAAAKASEVAAVHGQIDKLATDEIAARKAEALTKTEGLAKLQENARALVPTIAASGTQLSDAQKTALKRQTGYDDLTFDTIFNASKTKAEQIDYKTEVIKNDDGSSTLLMYGTDPKDGTLKTQKYQISGATPGSNIKVYDGRPYTQVVGADGSISLKPVAGFIQKASAPTETEKNKQAISDMSQQLQLAVGKDGFISPPDYQKALNAWVSSGRTAQAFNDTFANFRNPQNTDYNIIQ